MKKKALALLFFAILLLSGLSGCGQSTDEKFMESLAKGLEARWELTTANESGEITKADWESYFAAEYDQIIKYKDKTFENGELERWAKIYIHCIEASKEVLAYYGTNQWGSKYTNGIYHERAVALYEIHSICPVPVSPESQEKLIGLLNDGEVINMVNNLFEVVEFKKIEESYGWSTYEAIVENTTSIDFSAFYFDVDLIDKDGVTIATETAWAENWQAGEIIKFTFTTEEVFAEMDVEYCGWDF